MHARTIILGAAGLAVVGSIGLAAPAVAADHGPNPNASCVGQVFQPQATGDPGAIARRIAEIKSWDVGKFGWIISDFARWEDCGG